MASRARRNEILLILGFLGVASGVPLVQIGLELCRGERVQFTDLFRYEPSERNLRRFEATLEDKSWFQQTVRPPTRRLLFAALGDAGAKGVIGRDGWLFYRPGVRYLIEPDRVATGDATWRAEALTRRGSVVEAIVRFRDQLAERGIGLLVVPVPGKASVYPDRLTRRMEGKAGRFRSPTEELLEELARRGVETVDLFARFRAARQETPDKPYYLARDTHWTPQGAKLAARAVARKLRGLGWAPTHRRQYRTRRVRVRRRGDILEMMRAPGIGRGVPDQIVNCEQILDKAGGLLIGSEGGPSGTHMSSHLKDTPLEPLVLLLGDSFSRIYQLPEPRSLGAVLDEAASGDPGVRRNARKRTRRLLPGSAGLPSLLARELSAPVDYIVSDGGAGTDVRRKLSINAEILENKNVVVWQFAERDIRLGEDGWRPVPLPPEL